jgi:hypothetical protein
VPASAPDAPPGITVRRAATLAEAVVALGLRRERLRIST